MVAESQIMILQLPAQIYHQKDSMWSILDLTLIAIVWNYFLPPITMTIVYHLVTMPVAQDLDGHLWVEHLRTFLMIYNIKSLYYWFRDVLYISVVIPRKVGLKVTLNTLTHNCAIVILVNVKDVRGDNIVIKLKRCNFRNIIWLPYQD